MTGNSSLTVPLKIFSTLLLCTTAIDATTVEFGACFQPANNSYRCAVSSSFCYEDQNETWFKPHELKMLEGRKICSCDDTFITNCSPMHGYRGRCALEADSCPTDSSFNSKIYFYNDGATCMCHGMVAHPYTTNVIDMEKTTYGACSKDGIDRCAVFGNDCVTGEVWLSPIELEEMNKEPCTCDKVRTSSCSGIKPQCVVNQESCDSPYQFVNAYNTQSGGTDCFLCTNDVFDDKKTSDDDVKTTSDDDDKTTSDDDDDKKSSALASSIVSETTFNAVLGLMIASMVTSVALAIVIIHRGFCGKKSDIKAKTTDGSVV